MCCLIAGTISFDIYINIICPVAMPRIFELLQIVEEKGKISDIKKNVLVLSAYPE